MIPSIKRMWRSGLSLVLAVCMVISLCPGVAFAADEEQTISYVSFGDSMTNGYGLKGYEYEYHVGESASAECTDPNCTREHVVFRWGNGYLQEVPEAYPYRVAEHYGWDLTQMAMSAMRIEDLRWTLEYDYTDPAQIAAAGMDSWDEAAWHAVFEAGDYETWDGFASSRFNSLYPGSNTEKVAKEYQDAVIDADVISIGSGNSNFGVFLINYLLQAVGFEEAEDLSWLDMEHALREYDEQSKAMAQQICDMIKQELGAYDLPETMMNAMVDAISYTLISYAVNYAGVIERIVELNPDVEVIVVGLMNTMQGMTFSYGDQIIDFGEIMYDSLSLVNAYLAGRPAMKQAQGFYPEATFYYAEAPNVDVLVNNYSTMIYDKTNTTIRDRFITMIAGEWDNGVWEDGMIWELLRSMIKDMVGAELQPISLSEIQTYEAMDNVAKGVYAADNTDKAISIALYLAFEDATIQASRGATLSVEGFMALQNVDASLFEQVLAYYSNNIGPNGDKYEDDAFGAVAIVATEMGLPVSEAIIRTMYNSESDIFGITENVDDLKTLLALPETMSGALQSDELIFGLLNLFARCLIGNGLGAHPSAAGHKDLTAAIIDAYDNGHTTDIETSENINVALKLFVELLQEYGPDIKKEIYDSVKEAEYAVKCNSHYIALGDEIAAGDSYVSEVAKQLDVKYTNLAAEGMKLTGLYDVIQANSEAIAQADLITLGFGNNGFTNVAIEKLMERLDNKYVAPDWLALVGEENVGYVEQALEVIGGYLKDSVGSGEVSGVPMEELMMIIVENYAYSVLSYMFNLPEVVNDIREINPDAVVALIGMYNPLDGVSIDLDGSALEIGDYLQYLVEAVNVQSATYAMNTGNAIYVDAPDVEISNTKTSMTIPQFTVEFMLNKGKTMQPTANGQKYIADRIMAALKVDRDHFHTEGKPVRENQADGEYDEVVYCVGCGIEMSRKHVVGAVAGGEIYRLMGATRFETSLEIADEMKEVLGVESFASVVVASGDNFADALAGSYLASEKNAPILMYRASAADALQEYIAANLSAGGSVYLLGGEAAVPAAFQTALEESGITVKRLYGSTRYETNIAILEEAGIAAGQEILVATGRNYADSLSGSATGLPILLVDGKAEALSDEQTAFLSGLGDGVKLTIVGGTSAVSDALAEQLGEYGEVDRLFGNTRYETSVAIANRYFADVNVVVVASGKNYPDGLCGGPLANALKAPLLLTQSGAGEAAVSGYLNGKSIDKGIVLGGTSAVADKVVCKSFNLTEGTVIPAK